MSTPSKCCRMGHDGIRVGVKIIKKFVIKPTKICYRLVCNYPFLVGILLIVLFLYSSFPFLFRLLVSASPVIVCTAVLLGTLLSFGDHTISTVVEEDEEKKTEIVELRTAVFESRAVVADYEGLGEDIGCTELVSGIVERNLDEEPLIDIVDREGKFETRGELVDAMSSYRSSREVEFGKQSMFEVFNEIESVETREAVGLGDHKTGIEVGVCSSHEILEDGFFATEKAHSENFEVGESVEGSTDVQMSNHLDSFMASERGMDDYMEKHETDEKSVENQIRDQLESSSGSWTQFDVLEDGLSPIKKIQVDNNNLEDYISGEGSVDAQIGSPLELSLGSWNHFDSDHDGDDESGSDSDGAESSSPDASMADIIPMLDELHPLLEEDENPLKSNLSSHGSIHSNDDSDQQEDDEVGDVKSDGDEDDENEEETQNGKEDSAKSAINWTEEDQKNFMELGTSDLERNQRLESLIARRRSRRMVSERTLLDLEGMDLSFPIAPISTARYNPFDNSQDSYADLNLPPIPGSAPSIMVQRRNPFDLPYDSSEEKPDLTGDSFQEEFMELGQRDSANQKAFKRNETFSAGSSIFDFGRQTIRASRFRPYFVPERTDSDVMSYSSFERQFSELSESRMSNSSLQRQSSELSESKASSVADTDITYTGHVRELSPEIGHPSDVLEHESQCSDDVGSISDDGNATKDVDHHLPVNELIEAGNSLGATTEVGEIAETREDGDRNDLKAAYRKSEREVSPSEVQLVGELIEMNHRSISPLSLPKAHDGPDEDVNDRGLVNNKVHNLEDIDISHKFSLETVMSDVPTDHSHKEPVSGLGTEAVESHPKEPIYDSSPLAINRNSSSSSICSDLQRETSEIDLYHVQRDLFAKDESKIDDKDAEDSAQRRGLEPEDDGASANEVNEVTGYSGTESHFAGINQQLSNSLASPMAEYDFHLSKDSSERELLEKELLDDEIPLNEAEQILTEGDNVEGHHADKLDTSVTEISFEDGYKSSIDLLVPPQEKQTDFFGDHVSFMESNLSSSEVTFKEETETEISGSEHFLASIYSKNNHDDDASRELLFALDEAHFLPHDSLIFDPEKQVQSVVRINHGEFDQANQVGETFNILKVQEPEDTMLSSLLQNDESSAQLEEVENTSLSELAVEKNVQDIAQGLQESVVDGLIMSEEMTDMEIDEDLLSELDAVGDFSVNNISLNLKKSYLDDEVSSDIPEEVMAEIHSNSGKQFGDSTSLLDITEAQISDSVSETSEPVFAWRNESISDSHIKDISSEVTEMCEKEIQTVVADEYVEAEDIAAIKPVLHVEDANIGFLTLEDQSVEDVDDTIKKLSEEETQNSLAAEPIQVEDTDLIDLNLAHSKESSPDSPTSIPLIETTLNDSVLVLERSEFNSSFPEGNILDSSRLEPRLGVSVDTEISELSGEDFKGLETYTDSSFTVKALQMTAEPEIVCEESVPLPIDTDSRCVQDLPVFGDQIDTASKKVSEEEVQSSLVAEPIQMEDTDLSDLNLAWSKESNPDSPKAIPLIETTLNDVVSLPEGNESNLALSEGNILDSSRMEPGSGILVNTSGEDFEGLDTYTDKSITAKALEMTAESGIMSEEFLALPPDTDVRDLHDSPVLGDQIERSESVDFDLLQPDIESKKMADLPVVQVCTSNAPETEVTGPQIERRVSIGSESVQNDLDVGETLEMLVDEGNTPAVEFMDQREIVAFVEPESLTLNEIQDSLVEPNSEPEFQIEAEDSREHESLLRAPVIEATASCDDVSEDHFQNVGELQTEQSKDDEDFRGIQESPDVEASVASPIESEDHRDINSKMEAVEVRDLPDYLMASQQKPEVGVSKSDDFEGINIVSSATVSPPNENEETSHESSSHVEEARPHESSSQVEEERPASSQVEEERSLEVHLEFSSSSSSSSSSSISHEV